jgi:hypothetical protein
MSMLFNEITGRPKAKKPKAAYARYPPRSNPNSCLKLVFLGKKVSKKQ